jgi:DNA-binding NarL/FixJ family response regulator
MKSILIVDDHVLFAEGLKLMLSMQAGIGNVFCYHSPEAAFTFMSQNIVDIIILDISMPGKNGIDFCQEIHQKYPALKVMALSMHDEPMLVKKMVSVGASAYILKNSSSIEIMTAISELSQGRQYFCEKVKPYLSLEWYDSASSFYINKSKPILSQRETEVLQLISNGMTNFEIAKRLYISAKAVDFHRSSLLSKFGVNNTALMIKIATEFCIVV